MTTQNQAQSDAVNLSPTVEATSVPDTTTGLPGGPTVSHQDFNLLRVSLIRIFVFWEGLPYVFQALMPVLFIALAVIGWGHFTPVGMNSKTYSMTTPVNLAIEDLWWPAILWGAVLLVHVWCMVRPLAFVSNISHKISV